jgi:hypothetical protein
MSRNFSVSAVAAVLLLLPAQLLAGGPARLCLPIDGVTANTAAVCGKLIGDRLGDKLLPRPPLRDVVLEQHENQWYALFYLAGETDVKLSEIDAALHGSKFSVPSDKLRFFGPVRLEVEVRTADREALVIDLAALQHVEVEESSHQDGALLVTLILPENGSRDVFHLLDVSPRQSNGSEPSLTAQALPGYSAVGAVATKHDARLSDVSWSSQWACRMLGTLAVPQEDGKIGKVAASR